MTVRGRVLAASVVLAGLAACGQDGGADPGAPLLARFAITPVAPGAEAQRDVQGVLANASPMWVQRIDWTAPAGLHHSRLDAPPDASTHFYPVMALPVGVSTGSVRFPPGYALALAAHQRLNVSYHFVNLGSTAISGEIETRFTPAPAGTTPIPIAMLALMNNAIEIPARGEATVETTCPLPQHAIALHSLASHMHQRGVAVEAVVVGGAHDGQTVYSTTAWDDAPVVGFDPPLALEAGTRLRFVCRFVNPTDAVVRYGAGASDEMCGVFAHFSPGMEPYGAVVAAAGQPCVAAVR
ncbi:MAG: hypothetical protein IT370_15355 [Deltaproteobacteria bacterium]|nr:hypothetical protein [Deltaproteobacteria bacterium]